MQLKFIQAGTLPTPKMVIFNPQYVHKNIAAVLELLSYGEFLEYSAAGFVYILKTPSGEPSLAFGGKSESLRVETPNSFEMPLSSQDWYVLMLNSDTQLLMTKQLAEVLDPNELKHSYPNHRLIAMRLLEEQPKLHAVVNNVLCAETQKMLMTSFKNLDIIHLLATEL